MDRRGELGRRGEGLAEAFLRRSAYTIVARNYRCRLGEIDLVALDGPVLVFVEVRSRNGPAFGTPLESVDARKQLRLADAARAEADVARAGLAEEQAALAEEIRMVHAQTRSGATRLRLLTDRVLPSAQATVDATLRNYRVGQVQFLTVLATEDALYRAELDAARAAAEHLTHLVLLEQLLSREDVQ